MVGIEAALRNQTQLKRVAIQRASIEQIMPFLKWAPNLELLWVYHVRQETVNDVNDILTADLRTIPINLIPLNEERAKLPGAKKIRFCVGEAIYSETNLELNETDLEFIRLDKTSSSEFDEGHI